MIFATKALKDGDVRDKFAFSPLEIEGHDGSHMILWLEKYQAMYNPRGRDEVFYRGESIGTAWVWSDD